MKNKKFKKILYYILNFTWGLPMTLIGLTVALVLVICNQKPKCHGGCIYFSIGKSWGGINLGFVFLTDSSEIPYILTHEFGHSVQNAYFGFLMPIIVGIPSLIRCSYRTIGEKMGHKFKTGYYDIWFEKQASELGYKYLELWR